MRKQQTKNAHYLLLHKDICGCSHSFDCYGARIARSADGLLPSRPFTPSPRVASRRRPTPWQCEAQPSLQ